MLRWGCLVNRFERPKRVTVNDLANAAGVSIATVSYVLSGRKGVSISASTRARVLDVAKQMGYRRNGLAAALRTGKINTIGIVCPVQVQPITELQRLTYISNAMMALTSAATQQGVNPILYFGPPSEDVAPEDFADGRVDGVILLSAAGHEEWVRPLIESGAACVEIGSSVGPFSVFPDHALGVRLAVKHLYDLGHRTLAYHAPWPEVIPARERIAEFKRMTAELGIGGESALFGPDVSELLSSRRRPTGLVCFNDAAAVMAVRAANKLRLSVPDDLSIVGFDDDLRAVSAIPQITTIHNPLDEIASKAIELLLRLSSGEGIEPARINIPVRLVIRESTGPVPSKIRAAG